MPHACRHHGGRGRRDARDARGHWHDAGTSQHARLWCPRTIAPQRPPSALPLPRTAPSTFAWVATKVPEVYDEYFVGGLPYAGVLREGTDVTILACGVEGGAVACCGRHLGKERHLCRGHRRLLGEAARGGRDSRLCREDRPRRDGGGAWSPRAWAPRWRHSLPRSAPTPMRFVGMGASVLPLRRRASRALWP